MDFKFQSKKWVGNLQEKIATTFTDFDDKLFEEARSYGAHVGAHVNAVGAHVGAHINAVGTHVNRFFAEVMEDLAPVTCISKEEKLSVPCPSSKSPEVGNIHYTNRLLTPPSQKPIGHTSMEESSEENNAPLTSEQTTDHDTKVKNDKSAPYPSEQVAPVVAEAFSHAALEAMSISSFFNEVLDFSCEKTHDAPPVEVTGKDSSAQSGLVCDDTVESSSDVSSEVLEFDIRKPCDDFLHMELLPTPPTEPDSSLELGLVHETDIDAIPVEPCLAFKSELHSIRTEYEVTLTSSDVRVRDSYMESIELRDNVMLGESCLVVDTEDVPIPIRTQTKRSFKKKLQSVLPFRMSFKKKRGREHEQLEGPYGGNTEADIAQTGETAMPSVPAKDLTPDVSEDEISDSEWTLV